MLYRIAEVEIQFIALKVFVSCFFNGCFFWLLIFLLIGESLSLNKVTTWYVSSDLLNFVVYTYCVEVLFFFKYDNTGKCIYVCIKQLVLFEAYSWSEWTYLIIFVTYISKLCIFILIMEFIYFIKQYITIFHKCLPVSNLGDKNSLNC